MLSVRTILAVYSKSKKLFFRTGPNGHLEFRGKTKVLQSCDMTQYKNSERQAILGRLAKRVDLGHTGYSKPWKAMVGLTPTPRNRAVPETMLLTDHHDIIRKSQVLYDTLPSVSLCLLEGTIRFVAFI